MTEIDLLEIDHGSVTAPAGCGKTELIADAARRHVSPKPLLVLTHTNAGVAALRGRLTRAGVRSSSYRLSTLDGWAMRLIATFPARSGHATGLLNLDNPAKDYPAIRAAAVGLLTAGHVDDIVAATYSRLIVDEYQDCLVEQHQLVVAASDSLATCVLGDPLQAIFGFGGNKLADWDGVCSEFPLIGSLGTPWRWINADSEELGRWLLEARESLLKKEGIDLRKAPSSVSWVQLTGQKDDHQKRLKAALASTPDGKGNVLIIGDSRKPQAQRDFAGQTPGATTVEAVDLRDLVAFARDLDFKSVDALARIAGFAHSVMTNVGADDLMRRVRSLSTGTARKKPSGAESAALEFSRLPCPESALSVLVEIGREAGVRPHRPAVLRACIKALQSCATESGNSFHDEVLRMREQYRMLGRPLSKRAVGSTLLLKGLEADVAVVLHADEMNAPNLYVAMTRGSRRLVICSSQPVLKRS